LGKGEVHAFSQQSFKPILAILVIKPVEIIVAHLVDDDTDDQAGLYLISGFLSE
jgi:hypothetical protein